jgi:hypothetical protein
VFAARFVPAAERAPFMIEAELFVLRCGFQCLELEWSVLRDEFVASGSCSVVVAVLLSEARPEFCAVFGVIDKRAAGTPLCSVNSIGDVIAFAQERGAVEVYQYQAVIRVNVGCRGFEGGRSQEGGVVG